MKKNIIQEKFDNIEEYWIKLERDFQNGVQSISVGIPKTWEIKDNNKIGCEVINETSEGKLVKVFTKEPTVTIDELILFIEIIIKTNEEINNMEKQFSEEIQSMKAGLEEKINNFYKNLSQYKDNAFETLDKNLKVEFGEDEQPKSTTKKTSKKQTTPKRSKKNDQSQPKEELNKKTSESSEDE